MKGEGNDMEEERIVNQGKQNFQKIQNKSFRTLEKPVKRWYHFHCRNL